MALTFLATLDLTVRIVLLEPGSEWTPVARSLFPATPAAGSLLKDERDLDWLWIDRRGLPLSVFLATEGGRALGLASVSADGRIAELILAPGADATEAANALLAAVETSARVSKATELCFFKSPAERPGRRDLINRGFRAITAPCATLKVLDVVALLRSIVESGSPRPSPDPCRIQLRLAPDRFSPTSDREDLVLVSDGRRWSLETGSGAASDARLEVSRIALTEYIFGSPDRHRWLENARIEPEGAIARVRACLDALRVQGPWVTPLGDRL